MNKFLIGAALVAVTSTTALAADLPSRRAPPVYVPPIVAPAFTWSGMYAGINAGYAFDANTTFQQNADPLVPGYVRTKGNGFTGGGQIGYNFQLGNTPLPFLNVLGNGAAGGGLVFGVEADAAYTDLSNTVSDGFVTDHARTQYVGTARGRLGYGIGNLLVYGTGGFAYGGVRTNTFDGLGFNGSSNSIRTGYAYGGGVEYAIPTTSFLNFFQSSAVTIKAEFIHYDLGTQNVLVSNGAGAYNSRIKTDGNLVRAGLNYKINMFNPVSAPVVARY
jgi:outer membrane immunogenic protein